MKLWQRNLLLLAAAVVLAVLPLILLHDASWTGADDRGTQAIQELNAGYQPWFVHLFDPSALGIERYMFGLQALVGSGVTFAAIGWLVRRRRVVSGADWRVLIAAAGAAAVLFGVLFLPNPASTELQDLTSALQGVCLGFFGYFVGFFVARRTGAGLAAHTQSVRP